DYDANPDMDNSGAVNPYNPGGGGNGGGGSSFNWTGTDPMSAKINGTEWKANEGIYMNAMGFETIVGQSGNEGDPFASTITIMFQNANLEVDKIYDFNTTSTTASSSYSANLGDPNTVFTGNLGGGKVKILEIDDTHIKGLFYFKGVNTFTQESVEITEGYFNIVKE